MNNPTEILNKWRQEFSQLDIVECSSKKESSLAQEDPERVFHLTIHAATRGNPGLAAFALDLSHKSLHIPYGGYVGLRTTNNAAHLGLVAALVLLRACNFKKKDKLIIHSNNWGKSFKVTTWNPQCSEEYLSSSMVTNLPLHKMEYDYINDINFEYDIVDRKKLSHLIEKCESYIQNSRWISGVIFELMKFYGINFDNN